MCFFRILLADNDEDNLKTNAEYLNLMGFEVLTSETPDETRRLLLDDWVHVAVLDMRLAVNEDEKDRTGLQIAKQTAPAVPKLILTAFPSFRDVAEAMRPNKRPFPPVINYLYKQETGLEDLADAVNEALKDHVALNQGLQIEWRGVTQPQLVALLEPELPSYFLTSRMRELEDLLRKLLPKEQRRLLLEAPFTQKNGRVLLPAYAFDQNGRELQLLLSLGRPERIEREREKYDQFLGGRTLLREIGRLHDAETTHFAALSYRFPNPSLASATTLATVYQYQTAEVMVDAVTKLYSDRLGRWYQVGYSSTHDDSQHRFYQERFGLDDWLQDKLLWQKIDHALGQRATLLLPNLFIRQGEVLLLQSAESEPLQLATPAASLPDALEQPNAQAMWGIAHGHVTLEDILLDGDGDVWLTDFTELARSPLLLDFVLLETAVKFAATVPAHELEQQLRLDLLLAQADQFTLDLPSLHDLPPTVRKMAVVVEEIRHAAHAHARCSWEAYRLGLLYATLAQMKGFDPDQPTARHETAVWLRRYITLAALCSTPQQSEILPPFTLNEESQQLFVNNQEVHLTTQEYAIVHYLHQHAGAVCSREEIIVHGLGDPYDTYADERLNTAVSRLRQKLEENAPRILHTVRGRGYRLEIP